MYIYIYIYIYVCIHIYIYIYIYIHIVSRQGHLGPGRTAQEDALQPISELRFVIFGGLDSSRLLVLRGGILRSIGDFLEILCQPRSLSQGNGCPAHCGAPREQNRSGRAGQAAPKVVLLPQNMPLLRLQSSEAKFTKSREIEPVRRSFCRHGSRTFTEVACLVPSSRTGRGRGGAPASRGCCTATSRPPRAPWWCAASPPRGDSAARTRTTGPPRPSSWRAWRSRPPRSR